MKELDKAVRAQQVQSTRTTFGGASRMVRGEEAAPYKMRISRMTVDKLGVRLYDRVSAVVAELVANAYDADAEHVRVRVPLNSLLAKRNVESGEVEGYDYAIEVKDDGHGMTPDEANKHFLWVGKDRRKNTDQGGQSRSKNRPVMGRKGIGKLAPFGICRVIEVISAGGKRTRDGYIVSHFKMDYDRILTEDDDPVEMEKGEQDRTYRAEPGTIVRLLNFLPKRVPSLETFHRQLASRFGLQQAAFKIEVEDIRNPNENPPFEIGRFDIPTMEGTRVDYSSEFVELEDGRKFPVKGWMGLAKEAYKNKEMAGVRIYARGKIVATTRDFEQPAGFTGEFTLRSYLVGEINADWLDEDDGEDLITTDRQDILWESDHGRALRSWGAEKLKLIGAASRKPRRDRVERLFMQAAELEEKAKARFTDKEVIATAIELGQQIGRFASEDELTDQEYVDGLTQVILSVAPHKALMEAFEAFNQELFGEEGDVERLIDLFSKTRIAEMASYAQIAEERVTAIRRLETVISGNQPESALQEIIAEAPWLVEATWTPITVNQGLKLFVRSFEKYYRKKHKQNVVLAIDHQKKRPDLTLVHMGKKLHIVELKAVGHTFGNNDWDRLHNYLDAFEKFFQDNPAMAEECQDGWVIDLVCDKVNITDRDKHRAYNSWKDQQRIEQIGWGNFLQRAIKANEKFLNAQDRVKQEINQRSPGDTDQ